MLGTLIDKVKTLFDTPRTAASTSQSPAQDPIPCPVQSPAEDPIPVPIQPVEEPLVEAEQEIVRWIADRVPHKTAYSPTAFRKFVKGMQKIFDVTGRSWTQDNIKHFVDRDTVLLYYCTTAEIANEIMEKGWKGVVYDGGCNKRFGDGEYLTYTPEKSVRYSTLNKPERVFVAALTILPCTSGKHTHITMEYEDMPVCEKCVYITNNTDSVNFSLGMFSV